jgi:hypothetical protein
MENQPREPNVPHLDPTGDGIPLHHRPARLVGFTQKARNCPQAVAARDLSATCRVARAAAPGHNHKCLPILDINSAVVQIVLQRRGAGPSCLPSPATRQTISGPPFGQKLAIACYRAIAPRTANTKIRRTRGMNLADKPSVAIIFW